MLPLLLLLLLLLLLPALLLLLLLFTHTNCALGIVIPAVCFDRHLQYNQIKLKNALSLASPSQTTLIHKQRTQRWRQAHPHESLLPLLAPVGEEEAKISQGKMEREFVLQVEHQLLHAIEANNKHNQNKKKKKEKQNKKENKKNKKKNKKINKNQEEEEEKNAIIYKVAVRSSGIDEDGATASFAGIHETYLQVLWVFFSS